MDTHVRSPDSTAPGMRHTAGGKAGRERRPTRLAWLVAYATGLCSTGYTGRMQFTLDFHRGGISHIRVAELTEVPVQEDSWH